MAEKKKTTASQLRPLEAKVLQFEVLGEMTGLLQRVRANKSKRSASVLVKIGAPSRAGGRSGRRR